MYDGKAWKLINCSAALLNLVSGVVEELSDAVARQTGLQKGNSVMALVGGGGYAGEIQYIHVH